MSPLIWAANDDSVAVKARETDMGIIHNSSRFTAIS